MPNAIFTLMIFLTLSTPAWAAFPLGWGRSCPLTIPSGQVTADLVDFPVLVGYNATTAGETNLPDEMMRTGDANAAQADGGDIRFTLDAAGTLPLHYEIVAFTQNAALASAKAEIWVKLPELLTAQDTTFYVWYKASSAQTTPAVDDLHWGSRGVWSNNYTAVWHLGDGTTVSGIDSTGNGRTGTIYSVTGAAGKIYGAANFNGQGSGTYIGLGNSPALNPVIFTISAWVSPHDLTTSTYGYIYSNSRDCCGIYNGIELRIASHKFRGLIWNNGSSSITQNGTVADNSGWQYVAFTYNGALKSIYANGALDGSGASTLGVGAPASYNAVIGAMGAGPGTYILDGQLDEVRLSYAARSAEWIAAEYSNQNAPQSFILDGEPAAASHPAGVSGVSAVTGVSSLKY